MPADHFALGGHEFSGRIRKSAALLDQVSVQKLLVIPTRDEAYLLRIRLFGEHGQALLSRFVADLGLMHIAQRKQRTRQLLLRETEHEVRLVLRPVRRTLQQPPAALGVILIPSIVTSRNILGPNLSRHNQ